MRQLSLCLLLFPLLFAACQEAEQDADATIAGRWELQRAMRNNLETGMLEGLYYEFNPDGVLRTNLMGNEKEGSYTWAETTITTEGIIPPLTYDVTELSDSTLHLRTELQGYRFDFELAR